MAGSSTMKSLTTTNKSLWPRFSVIILVVSAVIIATSGCNEDPELLASETDIPIGIAGQSLQVTALHDIIGTARSQVEGVLLDVDYNGIVIFNDCSAFPSIKGKVTVIFVQSEQKLYGDRHYVGTVSVDAVQQTLDYQIVVYRYWNNSPQQYNGDEVRVVLESVAAYVQEQALSDCQVTLSRVTSDWTAEFAPNDSESSVDYHRAVIDSITGEVQVVDK